MKPALVSAVQTRPMSSQGFPAWTEAEVLHGLSSFCPAGLAPHCPQGMESHQVQPLGRVQAVRTVVGKLSGPETKGCLHIP